MSGGIENSIDSGPSSDRDVDRATVAAFYLPQFHQIPENDKWWGDGFTEWTNVRRSQPFFEHHRQPQLPGKLGYYDLLDPSIHFQQQDLAAKYGVGAFCYYIYWFGGRRLLEKPLEIVLREKELPLDYFFCWANENWTKTWDGLDSEQLVTQTHDRDRDARIIDDLAPHLADPRYLRVDGKPMLLIYRSSILDDSMRTTDNIRERASQLGLGELHLGMVQSFASWDPRPMGFDSAVEFPPHNQDSRLFRLEEDDMERPAMAYQEEWKGDMYSYPRVIEWAMSKNLPDFPWFRGVIPAWDNTPRRMERSSVFVGDSPELFQTWLERALHYTYLFNEPNHWLVFVNSWNEWGEGAYLEPDFELGLARLSALSAAISNTDPLADSVRRMLAAGSRAPGDLLDVARSYFHSSAVLGRETLSLWISS
jgi:lipopolysaccharide biosynthesis protein